jgi:hypothetical protein
VSRPEWARRDPRPIIAAAAAGAFGALVLGVAVLMIVLTARGIS